MRKTKEPEMKQDMLYALIETEETHKEGIWLGSITESIAEQNPHLFQRQNNDEPKKWKLTDAGRAALERARAAIVR